MRNAQYLIPVVDNISKLKRYQPSIQCQLTYIFSFTATMEVPGDILSKLVCENCGGYLSRGPVHLMDSVRYRCGRCLPSKEEQGTRIEAYEELAKLMTFPCRYQHNGCTSKVPFAENEAHEERCAYGKYSSTHTEFIICGHVIGIIGADFCDLLCSNMAPSS